MTHDKEVAYISGAISSDPDYIQKFADAQMVLEHLGYVVLNPTNTPLGLNYDEYMKLDLLLVEIADTLVMLPDWRWSPGAAREHDHARRLDKRIIPYLGINTSCPLLASKIKQEFFEKDVD